MATDRAVNQGPEKVAAPLRRTLLKSGGMAAAGTAVALSAPFVRDANAAETTTWKVQTSWPAGVGLQTFKAWCATIDFTPDHQPILGPAITPAGDRIEGVTVASPGGHGMMWGPAVARVAADLAIDGRTDLLDVAVLGLDRFDAEGRSRLAADPIALPFPLSADDD